MSLDVDNAIVARWTAAGLDASIAPLDPGLLIGAPEGTEMPRANYQGQSDPLESESRGTLTKIKHYRIEVWFSTYETAAAAVKSIAAAMLNSEMSATGKLQMLTGGTIMSTHEGDEGVEQEQDATFCGYYELEVRWEKAKVVP